MITNVKSCGCSVSYIDSKAVSVAICKKHIYFDTGSFTVEELAIQIEDIPAADVTGPGYDTGEDQ